MHLLKKLAEYCEVHTTLPVPELAELERETHLKTLSPQMLCGKLQGQLLYLISSLMRPKAILEIGTFTGYSTICLAKGLSAEGELHTIEINPELSRISKKYFEKTGLNDRIHQHIGDAKLIVPTIDLSFDLVFIDAAKQDYGIYYDIVFDKLCRSGLVIADNVLWGGKVVAKASDKDTAYIKAFNKKLLDDNRVETLMLPLRDGILLAKKI